MFVFSQDHQPSSYKIVHALNLSKLVSKMILARRLYVVRSTRNTVKWMRLIGCEWKIPSFMYHSIKRLCVLMILLDLFSFVQY